MKMFRRILTFALALGLTGACLQPAAAADIERRYGAWEFTSSDTVITAGVWTADRQNALVLGCWPHRDAPCEWRLVLTQIGKEGGRFAVLAHGPGGASNLTLVGLGKADDLAPRQLWRYTIEDMRPLIAAMFSEERSGMLTLTFALEGGGVRTVTFSLAGASDAMQAAITAIGQQRPAAPQTSGKGVPL